MQTAAGAPAHAGLASPAKGCSRPRRDAQGHVLQEFHSDERNLGAHPDPGKDPRPRSHRGAAQAQTLDVPQTTSDY